MAEGMTPEQIVEQVLKEIAEGIIEEVRESMGDTGTEIMDVSMSSMAEITSKGWLMRSSRVQSFGEALEGCIARMKECEDLCSNAEKAKGETALTMAITAMNTWYTYQDKIEKVPQLIDMTLKDLEKNSHITPSRREYDEESYKIINYWGGGSSGSRSSRGGGGGVGSGRPRGSGGGGRAQSQAEADLVSSYSSIIEWIITFLMALLAGIFNAIFGK